MKTGKRLIELAKEKKGHDIQALAKAIGRSTSGIYRWLEKEPPAPSKSTIAKFCEVYGVTEGEIYGNTETKKPFLTTKEMQLIHAFRQLDEEHQDIILRRLLEMVF